MNGILVVDKLPGLTSAEVVRRVKRRFRRKVGHLGTLDPFASGVLPLCLGEGTKIAQVLNIADKQYQGSIHLGKRTDTGDPTGTVVEEKPLPQDIAASLGEVVQRLSGERMQTPPMYSAVKQQGTPLYKLARRGITVDRTPRRVTVRFEELRLVGADTLHFSVTCSKGTYIRVLAEEVGEALGTCAYLEELRRVRFGPFDLTMAVSLQQIESDRLEAHVIPIESALKNLRQLMIPNEAAQRVRQGSTTVLRELPAGHQAEAALLVDEDRHALALVEYRGGFGWAYLRVLN